VTRLLILVTYLTIVILTGPAYVQARRRRARVPGGDRHHEQIRSPQPGHADRLLRRREAPVCGLRVHAQGQPSRHPQR
jgi:hypothetical protein